MEVWLIRHAIAHDRDAKRWPNDDERPLTPAGRKRFIVAARGVKAGLSRPNRVYSSDLKRAVATAEILTEHAGWPAHRVARQLRPDVPVNAVVEWLKRQSKVARVAMVGHEPQLHRIAGTFLAQMPERPLVEFKKGAFVGLHFESVPGPGLATLRWVLPPRVLRAMA